MNDHFRHRLHCALCGSNKKDVLISKDFSDPSIFSFIARYYEGRIGRDILEGAEFEVLACPDCGFLWQSHILNDEMMLKLYEEWISPEQSLAKKVKAPVSLYTRYADQVRNIGFFFSERPHDIQVLDFGMGWGTWCLMAKAFGYDVYGFEISKDRLIYARNNAIKGLDSIQALRKHRFDFINADQVFEHLPSPRDTLEELAHTLKPEGILRIAVPNGEGLDQELKMPGWKASKNAIHPLEHINCFTVGTLKVLAHSASLNFQDISAASLSQKSFNGALHDPEGHSTSSMDHKAWPALDLYFQK